MLVDEICNQYADDKVNLTVRMLDDAGDPTLLIEGYPNALRMLARLLLAISEDSGDHGFQISPRGAGSVHFSSEATHGLYIHRLGAPECILPAHTT